DSEGLRLDEPAVVDGEGGEALCADVEQETAHEGRRRDAVGGAALDANVAGAAGCGRDAEVAAIDARPGEHVELPGALLADVEVGGDRPARRRGVVAGNAAGDRRQVAGAERDADDGTVAGDLSAVLDL